MKKFFIAVLVAILWSLWSPTTTLAACDPEGLDACVDWTEQQITNLGCEIPNANLRAAVADLYLNQGCRLEGTRWYDIRSGATVQGSLKDGVNTDTAGCIARYTPDAHLRKGGFFRTPKETLNGSLRNQAISNCSFNGEGGKQDASQLTASILSEVQSCGCAKSGDKPKDKQPAGGAEDVDTSHDSSGKACGENEASKNGACSCIDGHVKNKDEKCVKLSCDAALHQKKNADKTKCECTQLYKENSDETEKGAEPCIFSGTRGIPFDVDSAAEFQLLIERLTPGQSQVFEGTLQNGKALKIGVLKLADGSFTFSQDGVHFYDEPAKAYKPGAWNSTKNLWNNFTRGIGRLFGVGKYSGKNTAGEEGKDTQKDGQRRLDASSLAFAKLKDMYGDPERLPEMLKEAVEKGNTLNSNLLEGKFGDQIVEEIGSATGIDLPTIKKVLGGDLEGIGGDIVKKIYTLPADSVHTLAKEMQKSNFADAAHQYIRERQAGKSSSDIQQALLRGDLPELDFVSSIKGVSTGFARASVFQAYEEAYQRYLLNKSLKP